MGIELRLFTDPQAGDTVCPVMLCDACTEVVNVERPGNVLWAKRGRGAPFVVAHKGECDQIVTAAFEGALSGSWDEACMFVERLAWNYLDPDAAADMSKPGALGPRPL